MPRQTDYCRRERILDAAEQTFAEMGFAGASLRTIVRLAKVNLATVYYYFSSKDGLMEAVLKRRFGPLRQEQLEALHQKQAQAAAGKALPVEAILEALLLPALRLAMRADSQQAVARLIGRIASEPDPRTQSFLRSQNAVVRQAFVDALRLSLPRVSPRALRWRLEFVFGALAFVLCNPRKLEDPTATVPASLDAGQVLAEMLAFFSPGFRVCNQPEEPGSDRMPANGRGFDPAGATVRRTKSGRARVSPS